MGLRLGVRLGVLVGLRLLAREPLSRESSSKDPAAMGLLNSIPPLEVTPPSMSSGWDSDSRRRALVLVDIRLAVAGRAADSPPRWPVGNVMWG